MYYPFRWQNACKPLKLHYYYDKTLSMFLPGIWCTEGTGDPVGKYKSGNWDLEALNLGSAFDRDLRWRPVLLVFRGGYVSRSPDQERLQQCQVRMLLCPRTPPSTRTSRPCVESGLKPQTLDTWVQMQGHYLADFGEVCVIRFLSL